LGGCAAAASSFVLSVLCTAAQRHLVAALVDAVNLSLYFKISIGELCGIVDDKDGLRGNINFIRKRIKYIKNGDETIYTAKPHMDKLLRTIADIEVLRESIGDERVEEIIDAYVERIIPEFFNETDVTKNKNRGLGVGHSLGACPTWLRDDCLP